MCVIYEVCTRFLSNSSLFLPSVHLTLFRISLYRDYHFSHTTLVINTYRCTCQLSVERDIYGREMRAMKARLSPRRLRDDNFWSIIRARAPVSFWLANFSTLLSRRRTSRVKVPIYARDIFHHKDAGSCTRTIQYYTVIFYHENPAWSDCLIMN